MSRRLIVAAVLVLAASSPAFAQTKAHDEVMAAERAWAESYQSCKLDAMSRLLADDLILVQHTGGTSDKAGFMKSVATCTLTKVENDVQQVHVHGDSAVVQGASKYTIKSARGENIISVIYTRAYVKRNGAWQIVSHQSTLPPAPAAEHK